MVTSQTPVNAQAPTDLNWIASNDLVSGAVQNLLILPEMAKTVTRRFGSQTITGITKTCIKGGFNPVTNINYYHWEDDRLHSIVMCAAHAAGAPGAAVTLTVASAYQYSYPSTPIPPYTGPSSPTVTNPVVLEDIVRIGGIQARVTARTSTTFTIVPTTATDSIPAVTTATQIIIIGNAREEGATTMPESRNWRLIKYQNNLQIMGYTATSTGTALSTTLWVEFKDKTGKMAPAWFLEQQLKTYYLKEDQFELTLRTSTKSDNVAAMGTSGSALTTEGIYPSVENYGNEANYSAVIGYQRSDLEDAISQYILPMRGSREYLWMVGTNLSTGIDRFISAEMKNGAVLYNAFSGGKDQAVNFSFNSIMIKNHTFHIQTDEVLSDPTTLGADAVYGGATLGLMVPADNQVIPFGENKTQKESVPSIRINYLKGGVNYDRMEEEWLTGGAYSVHNNQSDNITVNTRMHRGLEGFAWNRWLINFAA